MKREKETPARKWHTSSSDGERRVGEKGREKVEGKERDRERGRREKWRARRRVV